MQTNWQADPNDKTNSRFSQLLAKTPKNVGLKMAD
jgi:hypothetical protein